MGLLPVTYVKNVTFYEFPLTFQIKRSEKRLDSSVKDENQNLVRQGFKRITQSFLPEDSSLNV